MRAVLQRVTSSSVVVDDETVGAIEAGLCVLLGAENDDTPGDIDYIVKKICELRIFEDDNGKMNLSVADIGGEVLLISQFTLLANTKKGRRPSFVRAMTPSQASDYCDRVADAIRARGIGVATGVFGADMKVEIHNDGPVTILIDSQRD